MSVAYIMDNASEGERVEQKTDAALTTEQLKWAGLHIGDSVLDLGCAAGTTSRIMAGLVGPEGRVVGVDASSMRVEDARSRTTDAHIEFVIGDAESIPLEDDSFDVCWSRFLFEYLPRPARVLREMIRVTRPGGSVVVSDLDGNCIWHAGMDDHLQREIAAAIATFGPGFDAEVGRKLPALFLASELSEVSLDIRPYHVVSGRDQQSQSIDTLADEAVRCSGLSHSTWLVERASEQAYRRIREPPPRRTDVHLQRSGDGERNQAQQVNRPSPHRHSPTRQHHQ
jgi:SAM-dependent methyltransferase